MHLSDRVTGGVLVLLGAASAYAGSRLPAVPGQDVGPAAFPMVIGCGLVVCGLMIALGIGARLRGAGGERGGRAALRRAAGAAAAGAAALLRARALSGSASCPPRRRWCWRRRWSSGRGWRLAVPLAIAAPLLVHLVFYKLLRVPLPAGVLPAPWARGMSDTARSAAHGRGAGRAGRDPRLGRLRAGGGLPARPFRHHGDGAAGARHLPPLAHRGGGDHHHRLRHGDLLGRHTGLPAAHPRHAGLRRLHGRGLCDDAQGPAGDRARRRALVQRHRRHRRHARRWC